jgi:AbiV family abortive infection protein
MKRSWPEFQRISRLAYSNGVDLLDEARLLLKEKQSPRAFALAVASVEELMKSYLADTVWKQDVDPNTLVAVLNGRRVKIPTSHGAKHHLFALFLIMQSAQQEGSEKMESVRKALTETLDLDAVDVKGKQEIKELVASMERLRQDSLYVDTKEVRGIIKTPKQVISKGMCKDLFAKIEAFLPTVETNLKLSKEKYQSELLQMQRERADIRVRPVNSKEKSPNGQ